MKLLDESVNRMRENKEELGYWEIALPLWEICYLPGEHCCCQQLVHTPSCIAHAITCKFEDICAKIDQAAGAEGKRRPPSGPGRSRLAVQPLAIACSHLQPYLSTGKLSLVPDICISLHSGAVWSKTVTCSVSV